VIHFTVKTVACLLCMKSTACPRKCACVRNPLLQLLAAWFPSEPSHSDHNHSLSWPKTGHFTVKFSWRQWLLGASIDSIAHDVTQVTVRLSVTSFCCSSMSFFNLSAKCLSLYSKWHITTKVVYVFSTRTLWISLFVRETIKASLKWEGLVWIYCYYKNKNIAWDKNSSPQKGVWQVWVTKEQVHWERQRNAVLQGQDCEQRNS
jgi:hypothetical protein